MYEELFPQSSHGPQGGRAVPPLIKVLRLFAKYEGVEDASSSIVGVVALLIGVLLGLRLLSPSQAVAQAFGPIITIPIEKVRELYNNPHENGNGKSCGVKLYGEWPVYLNYPAPAPGHPFRRSR